MLTADQEYSIAFGVWILGQIKYEGMDKERMLEEIRIRRRQIRQIELEVKELLEKYNE